MGTRPGPRRGRGTGDQNGPQADDDVLRHPSQLHGDSQLDYTTDNQTTTNHEILFCNGDLTLALAGWWRRLWAGSGCGGFGRAQGWCGWDVLSLLWCCCGGAVCWRPAISLPTQSVLLDAHVIVKYLIPESRARCGWAPDPSWVWWFGLATLEFWV
jgi:hypothetical protein